MNTNQIWKLLAKYLSGEASSIDKELIEEWKNKSEDNQKVFRLFQKVWIADSNPKSLKKVDINSIWLDTWAKIESKEKESPNTTQHTIKEKKERSGLIYQFGKYSKYAAAAVFLLAAVFTGIFLYPIQQEVLSESIIYTTGVGETLNLQLIDGSDVLLAPKSKLKVLSGFNETTREIQLEGEAYFSVDSNKKKPFWVYTENSITKVLGTQFNVMALLDESLLEVLVTEGIVGVEKGKREQIDDIILKEGSLLQTDEQLAKYEIINDIQSENYLKWKEGLIHFEELNLSRITDRLERWYPVEIILKSEDLDKKNLTAEFSSSQPLEEILDAISLALGVEYKRNESTITIYD
ncbi:MAG: DUF4974 domain-containing protein [Gracilimonas sp.]|uniref:FecR family protein n=1 Tax=Gracilimonas sp. TaxID=1974203 RepID=UPI003751BA99|nr:DUF4974 domain-containing protein [Gracilimonas sp.]